MHPVSEIYLGTGFTRFSFGADVTGLFSSVGHVCKVIKMNTVKYKSEVRSLHSFLRTNFKTNFFV